MSQCNYCSNKKLQKEARKAGLTVTHIKAKGPLKGINAYIHPKNIDIAELSRVRRAKYFREWYMELGKSCECQ